MLYITAATCWYQVTDGENLLEIVYGRICTYCSQLQLSGDVTLASLPAEGEPLTPDAPVAEMYLHQYLDR